MQRLARLQAGGDRRRKMEARVNDRGSNWGTSFLPLIMFMEAAVPHHPLFLTVHFPACRWSIPRLQCKVLAYGQTGSGKTYTTGTGYWDDDQIGIIPQVMDAIFDKVEALSDSIDFRLRVSFIELLLVLLILMQKKV
ncbi:unnamed protein product [Victoria cruziana]